MKFSILIPHWRIGSMIAYSVSQFLKYKGNHDLDLIVIDNSYPHESIAYLLPFKNDIRIIHNASDKISSHGVALDIGMAVADNEWVICAESDSFPTENSWLDIYENIIKMGYDGAGSLLSLSGGRYKHPCGALYKKSVWREAHEYFTTIPYSYYPNFMMRDNFAVHAMIHHSLVDAVSENPMDWVELAAEYKGNTKQIMQERLEHYKPVCGAFHSGAGGRQESLRTYGQRTHESDAPFIFLAEKNAKIIGRLGYEPGQGLHYFEVASQRKLYYIPTTTYWVPGKENQQQERTVMDCNGFTHLWGISSYAGLANSTDKPQWLIDKLVLPEKLYNTLPIHQKI